MPADDRWYLTGRRADGARLPSKRHGRGKRWRVRWTDDRGASRTVLFERKADADRHDASVRAEVGRANTSTTVPARITVAELGGPMRNRSTRRRSRAGGRRSGLPWVYRLDGGFMASATTTRRS